MELGELGELGELKEVTKEPNQQPTSLRPLWKAYLPIENTLNGKRPRLVHRPRAGPAPRGGLKRLWFDAMHGSYTGGSIGQRVLEHYDS